MMPELLSLPLQLQVTLASGYAAYIISYTGIREHHRTIDIAFATLVFGLVATLATTLILQKYPNQQVLAAIGAFGCAVVLGILWRVLGRGWFRSLLRSIRVSHADDNPSAWHELFSRTDVCVTQVAIRLKNGSVLRCDEPWRFKNCPMHFCTFGSNGDMLLYLTHVQEAGKSEARELRTVIDPDFGDRITYVPATEVARVTIRHKRC